MTTVTQRIDTSTCANRHVLASGQRSCDVLTAHVAAEAFRDGARVIACMASTTLPATPWATALDHLNILSLPTFKYGGGPGFRQVVDRLANDLGGDELRSTASEIVRVHRDRLLRDNSATQGTTAACRLVHLTGPSGMTGREAVMVLEEMVQSVAQWNGPGVQAIFAMHGTHLYHPMEVARSILLRGACLHGVVIPCRARTDVVSYIALGWWPVRAPGDALPSPDDRNSLDVEDAAVERAWRAALAPEAVLSQRDADAVLSALAAVPATADLAKQMRKQLGGHIGMQTWWNGFRSLAIDPAGDVRLAITLEDILHAASEREPDVLRKIIILDGRILRADPVATDIVVQMLRLGRKCGLECFIAADSDVTAQRFLPFCGTLLADELPNCPAPPQGVVLRDALANTNTPLPPIWSPGDLIVGRRLLAEGSQP